jgi:hypothetical protein
VLIVCGVCALFTLIALVVANGLGRVLADAFVSAIAALTALFGGVFAA